MRLARIGDAGHEVPAARRGEDWVDARGITRDFNGEFFAADGLDRLATALDDLPVIRDATEQRFGAPIARPHAVVCVGMNYAAHAAESGGVPPDQPVLFLKLPNTVIGPNDDVVLPRRSERTDWEVELGVVIGRRTSYLDRPEQALRHVAGFCTVNDVSERTFQLEESGGQWSKGKCCATFTPTGPELVTTDEVEPGSLGLRTWVNGEIRQDSSTADMIFDVATIVHHLSQYLVLEPGDLVLTGTPEGVALSGRFPYLTAGDLVEVEVGGLGRARHRVVAADR